MTPLPLPLHVHLRACHIPFHPVLNPPTPKLSFPSRQLHSLSFSKHQPLISLTAKSSQSNNNNNNPESTETNTPTTTPSEDDDGNISQLGNEIQKAMKEGRERSEGGGGEDTAGLLSGVVEEIGKIEWPEFRKVVGTTGVVLGVLAGSSVVLLTVNAVLAELSDKVFLGKGVQDFFG